MHQFNNTPLNSNGVRVHRLLVGEANPTVRNCMLAVLRADGHEVVAMASGIDLVDTLAVSLHPELGSGRFDLVISDARMVGAREASLLRRFEKRAEVPPFVFTAVFRDKDLQAKANQFGALVVLDKPHERRLRLPPLGMVSDDGHPSRRRRGDRKRLTGSTKRRRRRAQSPA